MPCSKQVWAARYQWSCTLWERDSALRSRWFQQLENWGWQFPLKFSIFHCKKNLKNESNRLYSFNSPYNRTLHSNPKNYLITTGTNTGAGWAWLKCTSFVRVIQHYSFCRFGNLFRVATIQTPHLFNIAWQRVSSGTLICQDSF